MCLVETFAFGVTRSAHDTFFKNGEPNHLLEMNLSYLQNMPKLLNCSFLVYYYTTVSEHDIFRTPQKNVWSMLKCTQNFFSPNSDNNFDQACHL